MVGTASTVRSFLLAEVPGPWGVDALRHSRLPDDVARHLHAEGRKHGVRTLLIRRHGRSTPSRPRVFAAHAAPTRPWVESTSVEDLRDLRAIDLGELGAGRSPGLIPHQDPLFLVCTHGRHDACCAERGRPVAARLDREIPEQTWEVSHIGGDRFAGNMLVLPQGLYYGRLTPDSAVAVADRHQNGHLSPGHLRGRCCYPFAVQAAEVYLRQETGLTALDDLTLSEARREHDLTRAVFEHDDSSWLVQVRTSRVAEEALTCLAVRPNAAPAHHLVSITPR